MNVLACRQYDNMQVSQALLVNGFVNVNVRSQTTIDLSHGSLMS